MLQQIAATLESPGHNSVPKNCDRRNEFMRSPWRVAAVALVAIIFEQNASAAEIKMLTVPGMKAAFDELVPQFERSAGQKVAIRYEIFARQKAEVEKAEFDVAVFARSAIDELRKQGKIAPASTSDLVRTSIGVAVRKGVPKPGAGRIRRR
jgi:molybdate transport system substrate-binding protein